MAIPAEKAVEISSEDYKEVLMLKCVLFGPVSDGYEYHYAEEIGVLSIREDLSPERILQIIGQFLP